MRLYAWHCVPFNADVGETINMVILANETIQTKGCVVREYVMYVIIV